MPAGAEEMLDRYFTSHPLGDTLPVDDANAT